MYRILCVTICFTLAWGVANARLNISGSSTLYPFAVVAAEEFVIKTGYESPIIESVGTGSGFKELCKNNGSVDVVNASREVKESEIAMCKKNGIVNLFSFVIGYDAVIFAQTKHSPSSKKMRNLTSYELFLALSRYVPLSGGGWVKNPYKYWSDINPSLGKRKIVIYGPSSGSGTRDSMVELLVKPECDRVVSTNPINVQNYSCGMVRNDGLYVESGENDNIIIRKLSTIPGAVGIFGFAYYKENSTIVDTISINAVKPSEPAISSGSYMIARPLYMYFDADKILKQNNAELYEFALEMQSKSTIGSDGYLHEYYLVPIPENKINSQLKNFLEFFKSFH